MPSFGTAVLVNVLNEAGGLPTRNFSAGQFEGAAKISGERIAGLVKERCGEKGPGTMDHNCHPGCIIKCSNRFPDASGEGVVVSCIEYETTWALGANCGIDDIDFIAMMTRECNDIGLDTIEAGNTVAMVMEGGLLEFGDKNGALKTFDEIRKGTPLGRIMGQGVEATRQGVRRLPRAHHQGPVDARLRPARGQGYRRYLCHHTHGRRPHRRLHHCAGNRGRGRQSRPVHHGGQGRLSQAFQATTAFIDSSGYCLFIAFPILDFKDGWAGMAESVAGVTGQKITGDDVIPIGKEILKIERLFNERAGFTKEHDRPPEFMRTEAIKPHNATWTVTDAQLDEVFAYVHE